MSEIGTVIQPGDPPAPARGGSLRAPRPRTPASEAVWGAISTLALFAWLAWQWGLTTAAAGMAGLFIHEAGHMAVINALGCGPSRIRIIPFLGGAATMERAPQSDFHGVLIAVSGPIAGLVSAYPFILASRLTGDGRWLSGAAFIAIINLLNLLPAPPLDGSKALGPALARIHPLLEKAVLAVIGAAAAYIALRRGSLLFGAFIAVATLGALKQSLRTASRPLSGPEWFASVGLWIGVLAAGLFTLWLSFGAGGSGGVRGLALGSGF